MKTDSEDMAARREEALAKKAAAEAKRAARAKPAELAEVERLEREAHEEEAIADAEAQYGDLDEAIKVVRTSVGIVIVKRPAAILVRRFHDAGKGSIEAKDKLSRPCVVYPSADEYAKLAGSDSGPALISAVADAAVWLAGFGRKEL